MMYGLDIGGTKIELAIFDDDLQWHSAWRLPTPGHDYALFLTTIAEMVAQADAKTASTGSVGIGLPGIVDHSGCAISANVACINGQNLTADIGNKLNRPVAFINDVKAFTLSEAYGGAADSHKRVLGVVLGTGVAGGFCIDQRLYSGRQNIACEFGHIPLPAILQQRYNFPLKECGCGLLSCMEQYISGPGLFWMCTHFGESYSDVPVFIGAVKNGNKKALEIFAAYIDCLACFFAQLNFMYDPDVIVLGGGLSNIAEIYEQLPSAMKKYLFAFFNAPKILQAKFGDSSGVRGAAILGRQIKLGIGGSDD